MLTVLVYAIGTMPVPVPRQDGQPAALARLRPELGGHHSEDRGEGQVAAGVQAPVVVGDLEDVASPERLRPQRNRPPKVSLRVGAEERVEI